MSFATFAKVIKQETGQDITKPRELVGGKYVRVTGKDGVEYLVLPKK